MSNDPVNDLLLPSLQILAVHWYEKMSIRIFLESFDARQSFDPAESVRIG